MALTIKNFVIESLKTFYERLGTRFQETLVSGVNLKTVSGETLLGSGNVVIDWEDLSGVPSVFPAETHNHDDVYLKLTGGTLTSSSNPTLNIKSTASGTSEVGIRFYRNTTEKAWIGYHDTYGVYLYNKARGKYLNYKDDGTLQFEGNTVWHAGNDGSGSTLDADLLDGTQLSKIYKTGYAWGNGRSDKPWHLVAEYTKAVQQITEAISFFVSENYGGTAHGILNIRLRVETNGSLTHLILSWSNICNINLEDFVVTHQISNGTVHVKLYCKCTGYKGFAFRVLSEHSWYGASDIWTMHNASGTNEYCFASIPTEETQIVSIVETIKNSIGWDNVLNKPSTFPAATHDHDNTYLKLIGGELSGDLTLKVTSGDSPKLIFQRGTLTDSYDDWRIFNAGGNLKFQYTTGSTTDWKDYIIFSATAGTVTINGNTAYHAGNLSIATLMGNTAIGDSDEPVYWSGSAFVKAGAYPTKSSWNYDDIYLKDILLDTGNSTDKDKSVSLTNTNVYLKLFKTINGAEAEDSKVKIYGNTNITVTTDASGDIKITGVDSVTNATNATYAANVGASGTAGTNYVTAAKVIATCNWYDTMTGSDTDTVINRWSEIVAFVANFTETPDLATFLSNNYLAKSGGTMTGPLKWTDSTALPEQTSPQYFVCIDAFNSGGTTKWASKANTLKALTGLTSTAIGDSDEPVYWDGSKFVKAGAYPTKSSWNYDDVYLKLSGGTMTGTIFSGNGVVQIWRGSATSGSAGYNAYLAYNSGNVYLATFGSVNSGNSVYLETYDTDVYHRKNTTNYKIWDESNDGSGSTLDADLLDGKHASEFSLSSHTHAFTDLSSHPTTLSGYGITDAVPKVSGIASAVFNVPSMNNWVGVEITTPFRWSTNNPDMFAFTVRLYSGYQYTDIVISGYCYSTYHWHVPKAEVIGGTQTFTVKFGWHDTARSETDTNKYLYIWIGRGKNANNETLKFGYGGLSIINVHSGHSPLSDLYRNWSAVEKSEDSLLNVQDTQTPKLSNDWNNLINKPTSFTPAAHTHYIGTTATQSSSAAQDLTGISDSTFSGVMNITGKQDNYTQGIRIHDAAASGTHAISSIWFRAGADSGFTAGMQGITADSTGMRFRLAASASGTTPTDYLTIAYGGAVTVASKFTASSSVYFTGLTAGTLDPTDSTEFLTSYASDNGFADTTGAGQVYRRKASTLYNYIKGKTDTLYVKKAGDTMTGTLTFNLGAAGYADSLTAGGINMGNSNIYGVNSIYTADASDNAAEGIHFYRDSTHVDTLWANGGNLYFVPNRAIGTGTTAANSYKIIHTGNYSTTTDTRYVLLSSTEQTIESTISSFSKGIVEFYRSSGDHIAFITFSNKANNAKRVLGSIGFYSGGVGKLQYRSADAKFYDIVNGSNITTYVACASSTVTLSTSEQTLLTVKSGESGSLSSSTIKVKLPATSPYSYSFDDITSKPTWITWEETSSTATYSLSNATWTQTITLPTTAGSYILKLVSGNSTLTGVFSIGASDNAKDEISLHLHGNGPRLYARTNGTKLELSRNIATATNTSVTITYRRMI